MRWLCGLFGLCIGLSVGFAHYAPPLPDSKIAPPDRQFGLPFAGPPGPNSWLLGQFYGNTTGAYRQRFTTYRNIQGIHFGIDLAAHCGTTVVAIGDGVISEVDGPHGSPPHNLVIEHGNGLASFYGHLLERPSIKVGTRVKRGQAVAKSGDSQFTCTGAPHLHLEIRDSSHQRLFNPIPYIAADWNTLALGGGISSGGARGFQRNLDNPRLWQQPDQQPQARRGGALLANFARTWPPAEGTTHTATELKGSFAGLPRLEGALPAFPTPQRITGGGCCVNPVWSPDSSTVLFLDKPTPQSPTALYGVALNKRGSPTALLPVAQYSPNFAYAVLPGSPALIQNMDSGQRFSVNTNGNGVVWSPNNQQFAWNTTATQGNFDQRVSQIWVSPLGGNPRRIATAYGGGITGWLDNQTLLINGKRTPSDSLRSLETLNTVSGERRVLAKALGMRGIAISPDGKQIIYYVAFDLKERNGLYLSPANGTPKKLDWFGSFRWRDAKRLVYVSLEPAKTHLLREYNTATGQSRALLDLGTQIAFDQWQVSPDGSKVVFMDSRDRNLYTVDLP